MRYILDNTGNRKAFNACAVRNRRRGAMLAASFSVYAYTPNNPYSSGKDYSRYSYGPAFYIGHAQSHLPKPNEKRARVRIRVYPKGGLVE